MPCRNPRISTLDELTSYISQWLKAKIQVEQFPKEEENEADEEVPPEADAETADFPIRELVPGRVVQRVVSAFRDLKIQAQRPHPLGLLRSPLPMHRTSDSLDRRPRTRTPRMPLRISCR